LFEGAFIDIQIFAHSVKQCSAHWALNLSDKSLFNRQFPPILSHPGEDEDAPRCGA
jgi:hypothetical protein